MVTVINRMLKELYIFWVFHIAMINAPATQVCGFSHYLPESPSREHIAEVVDFITREVEVSDDHDSCIITTLVYELLHPQCDFGDVVAARPVDGDDVHTRDPDPQDLK